MVPLTLAKLEALRDELEARGQRPSVLLPGPPASAELALAVRTVDEWSPFCEAMYLVMAADRRVLNVERDVLRGALAILSGDKVRSRDFESMIDAASRRVAEEGVDARLAAVVEALRQDKTRAETAAVVGAAIAAADDRFPPEEHALLERLFTGLGIEPARAEELVTELHEMLAARKRQSEEPGPKT